MLHAFEVRIDRESGRTPPSFGNSFQLRLEALIDDLLELQRTDLSFQKFIAERLAEGW